MNETEIIEYLKQNKTKGVPYDFMPDDVQDWCYEHKDKSIFNVYYSDGWNIIKSGITCCYAGIYALPEDYEPESEFKPHYEEFEVDKDGFFHIKKGSDTIYYCWFNWQKFLDDNFNNYNNFGGWVYENPVSEGKKLSYWLLLLISSNAEEVWLRAFLTKMKQNPLAQLKFCFGDIKNE